MNDIAINATNLIPKATISNKPSYLVVMEEMVKGKLAVKYFIALDRPVTEPHYINVKGFYVDSSEEEIINNYQDMLTNVSRDVIVEMMIPWGRIHKVRSLVFKAK